MPRTKTAEPENASITAPPAVISPNAVYTVAQVRELLGLRQSSLRREIREGRLRVNKRRGKYFFLGEQLLAWLRSGELPIRQRERAGESAN